MRAASGTTGAPSASPSSRDRVDFPVHSGPMTTMWTSGRALIDPSRGRRMREPGPSPLDEPEHREREVDRVVHGGQREVAGDEHPDVDDVEHDPGEPVLEELPGHHPLCDERAD